MSRASTDVLSKPIELEKLKETTVRIDINSRTISTMVRDIVNEYLKPLDDVMQICKEMFDTSSPQTASNTELEDLVLRLPTVLYYVSTGVELVGIKEDVANAVRKEVYNNVFVVSDGTIADKQAISDQASQYEYVTQVIHQRAYKMIKSRIEAGYEMLKSIKKVMTRRELEMGITDSGTRSY